MASVPWRASAGESFEALFIREYPRAVAIAARITRDVSEAEDAAQEAFLQLARRGRMENCAAWLHAACVHQAMNALRNRARRSQREERSARAARVSDTLVQMQLDPQTLTERRVSGEAVRAAMQRLRRQDAALLALRYGGELSYQECADALGIAVNQIGTRLLRAERALKKELS